MREERESERGEGEREGRERASVRGESECERKGVERDDKMDIHSLDIKP